MKADEVFVLVQREVSVKIRIRKAPAVDTLEGFDLRPFDFRSGQVYEVSRRLAEVLILWQHASLEPEPIAHGSTAPATPQRRRADRSAERA